MEQSSTHLKLETILAARPPRSCFNHHIRKQPSVDRISIFTSFSSATMRAFFFFVFFFVRSGLRGFVFMMFARSSPPPDVSLKMVSQCVTVRRTHVQI